MEYHLSIILCAVLLSGCASVAVTEDAIKRNTAHTLGLEVNDFTISDRVDEGVKTSYRVKTKAGRRYSCYVTGTMSYMGRVVSDALCTELGGSGKPASGGNKGQQCNDLLKAAGKC
ncbi:MAG: hypothetical protein LBQ81_13635 [Zoogloeaceae bacterium]|jgi:hypothetical protein|nr:hypothetical protein [Zoogloeaceae bacterium]